MKIKNLTPFPFGPKLTSRRPPEREMVLVVRGAFALRPGEPLVPFADLIDQGPLEAETFRPDDDDRVGEAVYGGDFADFKLSGEVLLRGSCHVAGDRPLTECLVRLTVGKWHKTLRVVGRRVWSDGLIQTASAPQPFTRMPLDYAHAFGGPGYAQNPVGKGHGTLELPNVEHPDAPVRSPGGTSPPASFAPISSRWPQRSSKMGTQYGPSWQKTRAPFYAEDFDWSYFGAAPPDQRLEGYLHGDEEVTFQNLHPTSPLFSVRLPGLRIRAFVRTQERGLHEVKMSLDTLFAAPDEGRLLLTWRGLTRVADGELRDVETVFIASEPLADKPLSEDHYRPLVEAFEKDPRGVEETIQKEVPEHLRDIARGILEGDGLPAPDPGKPPAEAIGELLTKLGGPDEGDAAGVRGALEQAIAKASPHVDLGGALAGAMQPAVGVASFSPGSMPRVPLADAMKSVAAQIDAAKQAASARGVDTAVIEKLEAMLSDPRLRQIDPSLPEPGKPPPPEPPEPGPGADCSGRDLTNQHLSGRDLRGANLKGAILSGAKLRGTLLAGADLTEANLGGADLEGADLEGANLTRSIFSGARAPRASFKRVTMDTTFFDKAYLGGATFDGASGETLVLDGADLTGARARGVRFYKCLAEDATLAHADFSEAQLSECYFIRCKARGASFADAHVARSSFGESDLAEATFRRARGERTIWLGATLTGAVFRLSVLPFGYFDEVSAAGAHFDGANLKGSRFHRALLDHASFDRANLFGASLARARLSGTRFTGANLYEAHFLDAAGKDADFNGANLKRAIFERA